MIGWLRRLIGCSHTRTIKEQIDGVLCWRCADCFAYQPVNLELTERRVTLEQRRTQAKLDVVAMKSQRRQAITPLRRVK